MICSNKILITYTIKLVLKNWDMENQIKIPRSFGNPTHCHRQFTVAKNRNVSSSESVGPTSNRPYISLDCTAFFTATKTLSLSPSHSPHCFSFSKVYSTVKAVFRWRIRRTISRRRFRSKASKMTASCSAVSSTTSCREKSAPISWRKSNGLVFSLRFLLLSLCSRSSSVIFRREAVTFYSDRSVKRFL